MSMSAIKKGMFTKCLAAILCMTMGVPLPAMAVPGVPIQTPAQPQELPVEIEIELGPGSLKQAPLWKEIVQLLENPYAPVVRRPGFGATMPALNTWPLTYNFLTAQPLRVRTSDGEISWDLPGPMFVPNEGIATDAFNVPTQLRTVIGSIVAADNLDPVFNLPAGNLGNLVVSNPSNDPRIPADGTIIAVPAFNNLGQLVEDGNVIAAGDSITPALETPVNEIDFLAGTTPPAKLAARARAEVLGKALFWDMQVGSDGVQACGTCHFNAGVDNRTKNQLNPNHLGGDLTFQVKQPNQDVTAGDFPFHKLSDPGTIGEPLLNPGNVASDANDVMSSMGVRFRQFVDIIVGPGAFGPVVNGVAPLLPDIGAEIADPIPGFQGLRRVEPRNTPTMHAAAFNFDNFWDGRARIHFNGGSVFGASDPTAHIFIDNGGLVGSTNGHIRPTMDPLDPKFGQPVRIKFSSLASQAVGPPLSEFEMSFIGRNWAKIGKKLLQPGVTPLANQLVSITDSVLGPFSNQNTTPGMPGLNITYPELIQQAFREDLWNNTTEHLNGAVGADPFDQYVLGVAPGAATPANTSQFTQMEANFSLFFALAAQMYEQLLIPDNTPFDQFMDANPLAANGVGQPGEQRVLFPTLIRQLVTGSPTGQLTMVPGFGPDELFGFDIFAGGNLTAALPQGSARNPAGFGSNPFTRTARCMLCHIGPEQTDHSISVSHGILKGDAEFEFPTPPFVQDPNSAVVCTDGTTGCLPAPEPPGPFQFVTGLILAEELIGTAQDVIEVEPRDMRMDGTLIERTVAAPSAFAFGDQGIYNIGLRPTSDDIGRGGDDPFGWPLAMSALALKNIGGQLFEPCDTPDDFAAHPTLCAMANVDPLNPALTFALSGAEQTINPGWEKTPINPQLPEYLTHWVSDLPAGELHPQIDELGFFPNTITPPNGGPALEFAENMFGSDLHCSTYNPAAFGAGAPNFGWGALDPVTGLPVPGVCPNNQSGVPGNLDVVLHGTWPFPNRTGRDGAFKAPQLRNVELTGPYFHTGSYLTLRQVVDFYMRGGDFPITNKEVRDQHIVDVGAQAFGFGRTISIGGDLDTFADALPDTAARYNVMPDTNPPSGTPEFATQEEAKVALVKFLLSLTDERVKFERAPFDRPEIFVPIDGAAPDNTGGRTQLVALSTAPCTPAATGNCFKQVPPVGAEGNLTPVPNFLGISSTPGPGLDHFDSFTQSAGNVNFDGTIDIADALRILRIAVGLIQPTPADLLLGDVAPLGAPDGVIDVADALLILRAAVGLIVI